jgi:hypothetical protein
MVVVPLIVTSEGSRVIGEKKTWLDGLVMVIEDESSG